MKTLIGQAVILVASAHCLSAPAPLPKKEPQKKHANCAGVWSMKWGSTTYDAVFSAGGDYRAVAGSVSYYGSWRQDGDSLWVTESRNLENPSSWQTYRVELGSGTRRGRVGGPGGVEFSLR